MCVWLLEALLDTIDFVLDDGTIVFRTCSAERDRVVFQIVRFALFALRYKLRIKKSRALNDTPSQSYRVSLAIWDQTVLPATRHK